MPKNILTIGYTLNGVESEYTVTVDAWRDLENATRDLQCHLIGEVLDIQPWVKTRIGDHQPEFATAEKGAS